MTARRSVTARDIASHCVKPHATTERPDLPRTAPLMSITAHVFHDTIDRPDLLLAAHRAVDEQPALLRSKLHEGLDEWTLKHGRVLTEQQRHYRRQRSAKGLVVAHRCRQSCRQHKRSVYTIEASTLDQWKPRQIQLKHQTLTRYKAWQIRELVMNSIRVHPRNGHLVHAECRAECIKRPARGWIQLSS